MAVDIHTDEATIALRAALARSAYERNEVRIIDTDLQGVRWLAATHRGLFGIDETGARPLAHGWFFGIRRYRDALYAFENCAQWEHDNLGRIIRFDVGGGQLAAPQVLVTGLHYNCHQIAIIDELLCVVDTANQVIRRFTLAGEVVDVQQPFAIAPVSDTTGGYLHINSIAAVGDRIGLILHNGKAEPAKPGELAWLDHRWSLIERVPIAGRHCHDIVEDQEGQLWHCASQSGEIICSDGLRIKVTDQMTRGLAVTSDEIAVGVSMIGPRATRAKLPGAIVIIDRRSHNRRVINLIAMPTDLIAL